jgi:ubiquinone/menaquinone biosynthesis C-methylase UbiE
MKTAKLARSFYNNCSHYQSFTRQVGWAAPEILAANICKYLKGGERILDVGCGPGPVGMELKKLGWRGKLIGLDIAEERLKEAKKKRSYRLCVQADAYKLPFVDAALDVVLSNGVVGLTGTKSVKEMCRLVKPGGLQAIVAGEIKTLAWSRRRFREACRFLEQMPGLLLRKDLGTGCSCRDYNEEHYVLFIHRIT